MAKKNKNNVEEGLGSLINLIVWISGVLVALAVGFGMIDGVLAVRFIPEMVTAIAGWVIVVLVLIGVLLEIINYFSRK